MFRIILTISSLFFLIGCSAPNYQHSDTIGSSVVYLKDQKLCLIDEQAAPDWICGSSAYPEYITAIGMSEKRSSIKRQEIDATVRAVEKLFTKIKEDVKMRSVEYFLRLGISPDDYKSYPSLVSNYVAKKTLSKVDRLDSWKRKKTGILYVLVGVNKKTISKHSFDFLSGGNIDNDEVLKAFGLSFDIYFDTNKTK